MQYNTDQTIKTATCRICMSQIILLSKKPKKTAEEMARMTWGLLEAIKLKLMEGKEKSVAL